MQLLAHDVIDALAILRGQILDIFRTLVGGADEHEHALAVILDIGKIRGQAVEAHIRAQRDEVGLELTGEVRLGVHLGGLGDVAALDVGDDDGLLLAQVGEGAAVGAQAGHAVCFVVGDLHLVAGTHVQCAVNDGLVEGEQSVLNVRELLCELFGQVTDVSVQPNTNVTFLSHACK